MPSCRRPPVVLGSHAPLHFSFPVFVFVTNFPFEHNGEELFAHSPCLRLALHFVAINDAAAVLEGTLRVAAGNGGLALVAGVFNDLEVAAFSCAVGMETDACAVWSESPVFGERGIWPSQ